MRANQTFTGKSQCCKIVRILQTLRNALSVLTGQTFCQIMRYEGEISTRIWYPHAWSWKIQLYRVFASFPTYVTSHTVLYIWWNGTQERLAPRTILRSCDPIVDTHSEKLFTRFDNPQKRYIDTGTTVSVLKKRIQPVCASCEMKISPPWPGGRQPFQPTAKQFISHRLIGMLVTSTSTPALKRCLIN